MEKLVILLTLILCSCSFYSKKENIYPFGFQRDYKSSDYMSHLKRISDLYISNSNNKIHKVSKSSEKYFNKLQKRIILNNENIFIGKYEPEVFIVMNKMPFYFSVPGNRIFFSSALIKKYVKNEDLFISIFTTELLRSDLSIYRKELVIPFENVNLDRMLKISKLDLRNKVKLNNLTYEVMKRSGFDPEAKLLWLQMENRNSIDFSLQYDNHNLISKEEFHIKNYIVKQDKVERITYEKNSSREFYNFRSYVERLR